MCLKDHDLTKYLNNDEGTRHYSGVLESETEEHSRARAFELRYVRPRPDHTSIQVIKPTVSQPKGGRCGTAGKKGTQGIKKNHNPYAADTPA